MLLGEASLYPAPPPPMATRNQVRIALPSPQEKRPQGMKARVLGGVMGESSNTPAAAAAAAPAIVNGGGEGVLAQAQSASLPASHQSHAGKTEPPSTMIDPDLARPVMELSYDRLVYAVGTKTGTFGVPGVEEYCYMLKASALFL